MKRVIYISGYGRSGSTVLENALSERTGLIALGEVCYARDELWGSGKFGGHLCGCGKSVTTCEFWGPAASQPRLGIRRFYAKMLPSILLSCDVGVVDSSKSTRGALLHFLYLASVTRPEIRIVQNRRSLVAVYRSWSARQNRPNGHHGRHGQVGAIGFVLSYGFAEIASTCMALIYPSIGVSHEDLLDDPDRELDRLISWFDLSEGRPTSQPTAHGLAGNRAKATADKSIRAAERSPEGPPLPIAIRVAASIERWRARHD